MSWQDPSLDLENVNAAYREARAEADRCREALERIGALAHGALERGYKAIDAEQVRGIADGVLFTTTEVEDA